MLSVDCVIYYYNCGNIMNIIRNISESFHRNGEPLFISDCNYCGSNFSQYENSVNGISLTLNIDEIYYGFGNSIHNIELFVDQVFGQYLCAHDVEYLKSEVNGNRIQNTNREIFGGNSNLRNFDPFSRDFAEGRVYETRRDRMRELQRTLEQKAFNTMRIPEEFLNPPKSTQNSIEKKSQINQKTSKTRKITIIEEDD